MNYQVLDGKQTALADVFVAAVRAMGDEPRHVRSTLYREVGRPNRYLIISDWQDRRPPHHPLRRTQATSTAIHPIIEPSVH